MTLALGHMLARQTTQNHLLSPSSFDQACMRLESALGYLHKAKMVHKSASSHSLSGEEAKLGHYQLDTIPSEYQPLNLRSESREPNSKGLVYRAEGVIDSIVEGISKFFKWIGNAIASLFGGGDSDAGGGGGATTAVAAATDKLCETASGNGVDEFLFKADSPLFSLLNLKHPKDCLRYYGAVSESTGVLVEMNKKAIDISKGATKEYKGEFDKDAVSQMKVFGDKTNSYTKELIGDQIQGSYYAYPVSMLKARPIVFGNDEITLPDLGGASDKSGKGFTPEDTYVKVEQWRGLVNAFSQSTKLFYDSGKKLKELAEEYKSLETRVKEWTAMEPESAKRVGKGISEMNRVASFVYKAVKEQEGFISRLTTTLKNVSENDLRKQAAAGRAAEADKAKSEKDAAEAAKKQENVGNTPDQGAHTNVD